MSKKLNRPDLVMPYQNISYRDKFYPYVLTSGIVIITFLCLVLISVRGVR